MFNLLYSITILFLLPAFLIIILWRASFTTKLEWLLDLVSTVLVVVWLFQSGNWSWIGYYFRFLWPLLLIIAVIISWKKVRDLPFRKKYTTNQKLTLGVYVVLILVFGAYNFLVLNSYSTDEKAIELEFPLQNGTYYIGHGGAHTQMNYHHSYDPQRYALDILKINAFGVRASGLTPKTLDSYHIFKDELFSPCDGTVLEKRDGLRDVIPQKESEPDQPEGNYIALSCDGQDAIIYLAHMKEGSLAIEKGAKIDVGEFIGLVGNSGNTTEPHLHIHAEKNGVGVPIRFDGRFLVRNNLMR